MTISTNLATLKQTIARYELKYQRAPHSVSLLAVSKGQTLEKIQQAITAGQLRFGENYLQEALEKINMLANSSLEWHFIGPIQANKTQKIAQHFHWVHSIDNINIAKRLNDHRPVNLPPLNCCIQVNISNETSKSGVSIHEADEFVHACKNLSNLNLRGLMAIPAQQNDFTLQRHAFHQLALLFHVLKEHAYDLDTLSMGMSNDYEAAIAEGSTLVRVGFALFGDRS
jgi:pyridoxal phosphate enzyme (YggS family)